MGDGVQPVRDGDGGAALAQMRDRVLHQPLGFGIERRGRLVEQDDRRVLDQRARDRDALALAAGKLQRRARRPACRSRPGTRVMNSWACAALAAATISASLAPGLPKAMFSRIVPWNRNTSWPT